MNIVLFSYRTTFNTNLLTNIISFRINSTHVFLGGGFAQVKNFFPYPSNFYYKKSLKHLKFAICNT